MGRWFERLIRMPPGLGYRGYLLGGCLGMLRW